MIKTNNQLDTFAFIFSGGILAAVVAWLNYLGAFDFSVVNAEAFTWYVIRSTGIAAYLLMTFSVLWGLALSSKVAKDWSPGNLSLMIHSTLSWLAVIMTLAHVGFLLLDKYFVYTLADLLVPFIGPYRPIAVGFGTLAFWITLIVTLSFPFRKRLGNKRWKQIHYLSYGAFILTTMHGLLAGTDTANIGMQALFMGSALVSVLLLGYRLNKPAKAKK